MDSKTLFANTPPGRLFFMAALPGSIGMLASALYQLIDGILVGQVLGEAAFAAINLAMPFVIINFALADLVGVGSSVPIAVRLGQGDERAANNIFTCACLLIVGTGALLGAALFLAAPLLMALMGAEGELASLATLYLRVYALFSPVTTINTIVKEYMDAGYVTLVPANHSREKNIALTPAGAAYAQEILEPVYRAEKEAMEQTLAEFSPEFMNAIEALTQNMAQAFQRTIFDRKELE